MREKTIEQHLVWSVAAKGGIAFKFESPGHPGVPDRLIVLPGNRIFFVELKAPGKPLKPHQERTAAVLRSKGAVVYVADCLEDVDALMGALE